MTYIVIEVQTSLDGAVATLVTTFDNINTAEQKYHLILSSAAVSDVAYHGAVMLTETGGFVKSDHFEHLPEPTEETTE